MKDTREQNTLDSARPKARTAALPGNDSVDDPFYDPDRDLPEVGTRFEILGRLGEGGMGEVFKARDRELDEFVALKVLTPQFGEDQSRLDRLKQEVKLARKISSNGVCRIHDLVELPNNVRGIAMEYIEGQTLGQLIDQGLSVDYLRFAKWGADVAEGLAAAHKLSIIHRDLKPDNIMITNDDRAMILDFGVARHHEASGQDQRLTREGMILGTVPYMAPEQLSNAPLDPRSDLYSLGLILAELVTGDIPAYGASYHETLTKRVVEPEIYHLEHHDPAAPEEFVSAVDHLLRTAIDERPFSAMMVSDHLRVFSGTNGLSVDGSPAMRLSTLPPMAQASTAPEPPATSPAEHTSNKPLATNLLIGVAALCVGLAIAVAYMTKDRATPKAPVIKATNPVQVPAPKGTAEPKPEPVIKAKPNKPIEAAPQKKIETQVKKKIRKKRPRKKKSEKIPVPEEL